MYGHTALRLLLIALFGAAGYFFPSYVDGWLGLGLRDLVGRPSALLLPAVCSAMIAADLLGALCPRLEGPRPRVIWHAGAVLTLAVAVLWFFRVPQWLGDYAHVDQDPLPWYTIESAEPLGMLTSYLSLHGAAALGIQKSTALALVTVASGASAILAIFLWARTVAAEWPLAFAMVVSSGFMVIFCGYPEKGTPKAYALGCWYVYFTTRAIRNPSTPMHLLSGFSLSLAALMHGSALCWSPAHAWYLWRPGTRTNRLANMLGFFAPLLAMAGYVIHGAPVSGGAWGNVAAPWQWIKKYCITNCGYDFWSVAHAIDVPNCLLVLSPVAVLCLPEALAYSRSTTARWLAIGTLGWLFLSATWFPVFGYLSDWDIFAGTPLALSFFTIFVALEVMPPARFRRLAFVWVVGSLAHTFSFWRLFTLPL